MRSHLGHGAYSDDFAYEPTGGRERTVACVLAVALSVGLAPIVSFAHQAGPVLPGFIPVIEATVVIAALFTGWMLFGQYRIRRHAPLAILASAYGVFGVLHAAYLVTLPGAFVVPGTFGFGRESAPWLLATARFGFVALVFVFAFVERSRKRSARWHAGIVARSAASAVAFTVLALVIALLGSRFLPLLVTPSGAFTAVETRAIGPLTAIAMFGAATAVVVVCGLSRRVHVWLCVVLVAMGLEVLAATVFGGGRFTFGWYAGRLDSALSSMLFFGVMQVQLASILRRAARNRERALALHDIVSLGNESSADRNAAMLDRAAQDLHFEWAALAHIDRGWVTLEHSLGDSPYPEGYRAPAGEAWLRDAVKRRALTITEGERDVPWMDETPAVFRGWSTFVTVPVFVDDQLYGLACFANSLKRRSPITDADKQFLQLLGSLAGVAMERTRQRRRLNTLAYNDALTGLPNRASLFEKVQNEMALSQRYDRQFALHFLDLDGFKAVNDTYGHAAGDEVLREVARRLQIVVRETDTVARLGGDEFVVLQPQIEDPRAPDRLAERLRAAFVEPIPVGPERFTIGTSIGTSRFPGDGLEIHALLDRADEALYRMKARRRKGAEVRPVSILRRRRN